MTLKIGILGSTNGTSSQGVIDAIEGGELDAEIILVISDRANAGILERAAKHGLPAQAMSAKGLSREAFDAQVTAALRAAGAEIILMIGYMRIVSDEFVAAWRGRALNVHPSLLPAFAGGMNMDVHRAVIDAGVKETGCTIHEVTEAVDGGPILLQKKCSVLPDDTPDTLKARVQELEKQAFVEVLRNWRK